MKNLYLFQPQDVVRFADKRQYWFPYTAGVLWAYAKQFDSISRVWQCRDIFFRKQSIDVVLDRIHEPDVVGFSVYIWNHNYSIAMAQAIKQRWPNCVLAFGGPEISAKWLKYDFADCLVLGEGERSWVKILETVAAGGRVEKIIKTERMESLDQVPSPYSSGVFDSIVNDNPEFLWNAPLETNRGCPYSCTFCDWGGLTQSKIKKFNLERVAADIDWLSLRPVKTIFVTDANFGVFRDRDLEIARMIRRWVDERPGLEYVSMNYAKMSNEVVFDISRELGSVGKGITFSVQSMNPDTLKAIKRQNMKINDISGLIKLGDEYNLHYYSEMILGLPAETLESWKDGLCELLELGQHSRIEILLAQVLDNTEMSSQQVSQYRMQLIDVKEFLPLGLDESGITESSPIVKSTSTMTTQELVEAYMYSWMITHLHINNYTKILAKYCRYVLGISYRKFYDKVFARVWPGGSTGFHDEFEKIKSCITNIYTVGETRSQEITMGNLQFGSIQTVYNSIFECLSLGLDVAKSFGPIPQGIVDIHNRTLENERYSLPHFTDTDVDVNTWELGPCRFEITSKNFAFEKNYWGFFKNLRRGKQLETIIRRVPA